MKLQAVQCLPHHARRGTGGFTLIEVMITIAIIGILAAVALPAYNDYIRRGKLPEAFSQLSDYRSRMEQYYQDNRAYGNATKCANTMATGTWGAFSDSDNFSYSCSTTSPFQTYTITATGKGSVTGYVYTIDQDGGRTTTQFKGATVTQKTCWLTKSATC